MDDYDPAVLRESQFQWASRMVDILRPMILQGFQSIFDETYKMCVSTNEPNEYMKKFQENLRKVPLWNSITVADELARIIQTTECNHLAEILVCVHVNHLKILSSIRTGNKQKNIDIGIPKLPDFIHKVYINCARELFKFSYLFKLVGPEEKQRNLKTTEELIEKQIYRTIRDSIPAEEITAAYLADHIEHEEEIVVETVVKDPVSTESPKRKREEDVREEPIKVQKIMSELDLFPPAKIEPVFTEAVIKDSDDAPYVHKTTIEIDPPYVPPPDSTEKQVQNTDFNQSNDVPLFDGMVDF